MKNYKLNNFKESVDFSDYKRKLSLNNDIFNP